MTRPILLLLLLATAAGAAPRDIPAATPNGAPQTCIQIIRIRESRVRDDRTIDFVMNDKTVYRNSLPQDCPELGIEQAFSYETSLTELCNTDIIIVFRNGGPPRRGASCGLGLFQPVTLAGR